LLKPTAAATEFHIISIRVWQQNFISYKRLTSVTALDTLHPQGDTKV
jgi:hypothetical protein